MFIILEHDTKRNQAESAPAILANSNPLSLYLHIPFCDVRCSYCAFNIYAHAQGFIPAYVEAMCNELYWLGQATPYPLHTIYFGGGTPSLLSPVQVSALLGQIRRSFDVVPTAEISFEANPDSLSVEYLSALREIGINRLSIGMQSSHSDELRLFARQHNFDNVIAAVQAARCVGFENLSLDLIYGVPFQTLQLWRQTLEAALALKPDHLSLYALQVEKGTALKRRIEYGELPAPNDDLAADMYDLADDLLSKGGFGQYEISSWAQPGAECAHNLQYWRNLPYLGVGAGAHGYANHVRYEVTRPLKRYIERAAQQGESRPFPLTAMVEHCDETDIKAEMAEHMITGLRLLHEGISISGFEKRFGVSLNDVYGDVMDKLISYGMLYKRGDSLLLDRKARLISNQVFVAFMP